MTSGQQEGIAAAGCEVAFDNLTRQLYATDASIYQIEPAGVAFPRSAEQASAIIRAAADAGISITPRGAGTSLSGGAIGDGLIVDFSRHNRQISDLDLEKRIGARRRRRRARSTQRLSATARILFRSGCRDQFARDARRNDREQFLRRARSGLRHDGRSCLALEIVLADGRVENIGAEQRVVSRGTRRDRTTRCATRAREIAERMPPGMLKRWTGYGIERFLRAPDNLTEILAGSEGTLAAIFSAELKISPLPREKGLGLIFFASSRGSDAGDGRAARSETGRDRAHRSPAARSNERPTAFQAARDLLELDAKPCEAILIVEFYDEMSPIGWRSCRRASSVCARRL